MHNVYLIQPAHPTLFDGNESYWFPYSVGCLWSYASQHKDITDNFNLKGLIFKRDPIEKTLSTIVDPKIAAFSCYIWNFEYCRELARAIKNRWPECLIIFGGPQITKRPYEKSFFKNNPYIDTIVNGEGEPAFTEILRSYHNKTTIKKVSTFTRMDNLDYPSPYTLGVFDKIINDNPTYHWQAVLETNRGCPYACTFCDWGSLTYSKVLKFDEQRVLDEITWLSNNRVDYVFIADANFGILYERDKKFAQHLNQLQISKGYPKVVIAQWAKNAKQRILEIAKIFFNGDNNRGFTVSVQSMNDAVLDAIKRKNMEISDLAAMLEECNKLNIPAYTEMILGLPHETYQTWKENHGLILEAGQHNTVDVWIAQILENSELNSLEQLTEHQIETVEVPRLITGSLISNDDITELELLVKSTKYMPFEDMIKSYLFSYILMTYHYAGWTHILSRFIRKYKNVSYHDFYSYLENALINGDSNLIIVKEYYRMKKFITAFLSGQRDQCEPNMLKDGHGAIWHSIPPLYTNRYTVLDEIFNIFNVEYFDIDQDLYLDLKSVQTNFIYDYDKSYPYTKQYNYDINNFVFSENSELDKKSTVEFSYPFEYSSQDNFFEKLYFSRRAGITKTRIKNV